MLGLNKRDIAFLEAVGIMTLLCLGLLLFRALATDSLRFWFIPENLFLAWAGLGLSWVLVNELKTRVWLCWQSLGLTFIWLFFLPNTWYVLTDFIHVANTGEISELYDYALIATLSLTGFILGFVSLWMIHKELLKRLKVAQAFWVVELIILVSSFAIYLGRVLRWSSWDVLSNPGGLLLNISDRVVDPLGHLHAFSFTGLFFVLISGLYFAFYRGLQAVNTSKTSQ